MLNLIKLKLNKKILNQISKNTEFNKIKNLKSFSPATKEWNNSIYSFNKNSINLLPVLNKFFFRLIKRYFNIYNRKLENKIKYNSFFYFTKIKINKSIISSHKIYVSNGEFKHTNENININIYIYNRQKYNLYYKLIQMKLKLEKNFLNKKLKIIKNKASIISRYIDSKFSKFTSYLPNNNKLRLSDDSVKLLTEYNIRTYNKLLKYKKGIYIKYITKCFKKEILHIHYRKLLLLNNFKLKYTLLTLLTNTLKKMYNKKIELNIINLKYFYLNSDIYTESIINKITKNRKKLKRILNLSTRKIKIKKYFYKYTENSNRKKKILLFNTIKDNNKGINFIKHKSINISNKQLLDPINILLYKIYDRYIVIRNKQILNKIILNNTNNKSITGVRLEAAGRLSKRHTASRSIFKLKSRGNLKNMDSVLPGSKGSMIRGINKSNIQYTKLNSVINIGAFGLKGWISNN